MLADFRMTIGRIDVLIDKMTKCLRHVKCSLRRHVRSIRETESQNGEFRGWRREVLRDPAEHDCRTQDRGATDRREHVGRRELRAACRGYTRPIFVSKLAIVAEEADESELWLRSSDAPACSPRRPLDPWSRRPTNSRQFSPPPFEPLAASASAPPWPLIRQSTIFNLTTICKSNNLQIFQFCEVPATATLRGGRRLSLPSVQS